MEEIRSSDGRLMAIIVRKNFERDGVSFISKEDFPLQLAVSNYKKGHIIKPHFHIGREIKINKIQEVVHVERGRAVVSLYDLDGRKIKSIDMSFGDTILFVEGGHGFDILEDTKITEVKQGPYLGKTIDKKTIEE